MKIQLSAGLIQPLASGNFLENFVSMEGVKKCYPNGERTHKLTGRKFSSIYNAMIHSYIRHTIRGVLVYLGNYHNICFRRFYLCNVSHNDNEKKQLCTG